MGRVAKLTFIVAMLLFAGYCRVAGGQPPPVPGLFQAGVFGDDDRTVTCISGQAGETFSQQLWAWVPDNLGLAYITVRFAFPANLDLSAHAVFNPLVMRVITTDYPGGTVEWNLLLADCPSGWIRIFEQRCTLLDDQPSAVRILAAHSMMRDCRFVLNDLTVLNDLQLNDPGCASSATDPTTWGGVKSRFR